MKKCPYCAEMIQDEAVICRYCGRDLLPATITSQAIRGKASRDRMSLSHLLFSSNGRIPRSTYWYYTLSMIGLYIIAIFANELSGTNNTSSGYGIFTEIFWLFSLITGIFVCIKRSHDRGRSGWFILLLLIPFIDFWPAIELAFVKGTSGSNEYGPDPIP